MRILATVPLHLMEVQVEIVKAFVYFVCKLAKYHEITFAICQKKKYKQFEECGLISKLEQCNIEVVLLEGILKADKSRSKYWLMDNAKIDKAFGGSYDLVLFYAYSISSASQMNNAFESFYSSGELRVPFNSMLTKYRQCYPLYYISRKYQIPTFQFIVDWLEPDLKAIYKHSDVYRFGVYRNNELGVRFMPIYDAYLFRKVYPKVKKLYDFVFGYTITYVGRKYLHASLQKGIIETDTIKLFARDRYWEPEARDDVVPQNEYFKYVEQAKFSYVVPANNKREFSIQRFYECISRYCIPLVDSRCNLQEVFSDKLDVWEFWEQNRLIVDLECGTTSINQHLASLNYSKLWEAIYNLPSINKLFNSERYENFYKKFGKFSEKVFTSAE